MSKVYKYEIFECDTCNRKTSKEIDPRRPTILNCTITYKCVGKLVHRGMSATKPKFPVYEQGVTNWVPRGSKVHHSVSDADVHTTNILVGKHHLAIAIPFDPIDSNTLDLEFSLLTSKNVEFKEYEYIRFSGAIMVEGLDDSSKMLSFIHKANDIVRVYINGVLLDEDAYSVTAAEDMVSGVGRRVTFTPALTQEYNSIKVVVYEGSVLQNASLTFRRAVVDDCAWGNVELINVSDVEYSVYVCEDISTFGSISKMKVINPPNNSILLLARKPWGNCDRVLMSAVSLPDIATSDEIYQFDLKYDELGSLEFLINDRFIASYIPMMSIMSRHIDDKVSLITSAHAETIRNKHII